MPTQLPNRLLTPPIPLFDQSGYRVKLEWGRRGARVAAERGDVVVIVDVLRFSTTVATALHWGGAIYPCLETEEVEAVAARLGAHVGVKSGSEGRFTLSATGAAGSRTVGSVSSTSKMRRAALAASSARASSQPSEMMGQIRRR